MGEGLTLGRVRRLCCLTVEIAGSGVGQTCVYVSALALSSCGNLSVSLSKMRIIIEISSKIVRMTYTNV